MVNPAWVDVSSRMVFSCQLLAQQATGLPPDVGAARVKMLVAVAGLVILGFGAIFMILLGGRMTRRYMHSLDRPSDLASKSSPDRSSKSQNQ